MDDFIDPQKASIDGLINWITDQRRRDPVCPLSQLLANHQIDEHQLVDIACIDLMQRRRMEHKVSVESYIREFPCLSSESHVLDLIDAELCIASELGEQVDVEDYTDRFPAFASPIRELIRLDKVDERRMKSPLVELGHQPGQASVGLARSVDENLTPSHNSDDFSIEALPAVDSPHPGLSALTEQPLDIPDWFVGDRCVASGPGRWLIRGRDSVRGVALALKVTELPPLLSASQSKQILDACEAAAEVRNPAWVAPRVAAIQNRHLGMIRPWLFARSWQPNAPGEDAKTQLHNFASIAFAVASAHGRGATHGGIHLENLLIDHEGQVQIVDAGASRAALSQWLHAGSSRGHTSAFASLRDRKSIDNRDMIKLVAAAAMDWEPTWADQLITELRELAKQAPDEACGLMGQTMIRFADSRSVSGETGSTNHSWRKKLARWLDRDS